MAIVLPAPSSALIDDVYDMVRCYGRAVPQGPYLFVTAVHPKPMLVAVSAVLGVKAMEVSAGHEGVLFDTEAVKGESDTGVRVRWDVRLGVEDVAAFVSGIDAILRTFDGFDRHGRRRRVPFELSEKLFRRSVRATFTERTIIVPVGRMSALETIRKLFDHPELLAPFQDHFGDWYLCLNAGIDEVRWQDLVMRRTCERFGVKRPRDFAGLTPKQHMEFQKVFQEMLSKKPN